MINLPQRIEYPRATDDYCDFATTFERHLLTGFKPDRPLLSREGAIITQGSCFAKNIHDALHARGLKSVHNEMLEAFNTPLANRRYFEYTLGNEPFESDDHRRSIHSDAGKNLQAAIRISTAFIFTIGLVFAPFRDGKLVFRFQRDDPIEWRKTSFDENVSHLRRAIQLIKSANPNIALILTLSPIPLAGYFGGTSAVVADCISKSILRAAIDAVMSDGVPGVHYWPAFEAIRWLSGHMGQVFGTEGADQRHPGASYINAIVDSFIRVYFTG